MPAASPNLCPSFIVQSECILDYITFSWVLEFLTSNSVLGLQDGQWKPLVVLGGFATVDSNQLSASWQETCPRGKL